MKFIDNHNISYDKWIDLIDDSFFSTPFQTPTFFELSIGLKKQTPYVFALEENNRYTALLLVIIQWETGIKRFFSRRGIVFGGPLIRRGSNIEGLLSCLLREVNKSILKKVIYSEIRCLDDYNQFKNEFVENGWIYESHLNVRISIEHLKLSEILAGMNYNRRRQIMRSLEQGLSVDEAKNLKEVERLFEILSDLYMNRVRLPLPELEFFRRFFFSKWGKVFVVKHKEQIIGGSFCMYLSNRSIYTMYYAGIRNYPIKIFPTHLAVFGAIRYGIDNNLKHLDFMGAGKPDLEYGVRKYKLEFGGTLIEHGRYVKVFDPILFRIGKTGIKILSKI
jgi:serine/alanine adding enzyme